MSKNILEVRNINNIDVFAYPNGNYDKRIKKILKEHGYQAAVTTHFGTEKPITQNIFQLKRINIHNDISSTIPLLKVHLSGLLYTPFLIQKYIPSA